MSAVQGCDDVAVKALLDDGTIKSDATEAQGWKINRSIIRIKATYVKNIFDDKVMKAGNLGIFSPETGRDLKQIEVAPEKSAALRAEIEAEIVLIKARASSTAV